MEKTFVRRGCALVLVLLMLATIAACGKGGRNGQFLSSGWLIRGDETGEGMDGKWFNGFTETDGNDMAETVWYCNQFSSSLQDGNRVLLTLTDVGGSAEIWLNGKSVGQTETAWGEVVFDVTDSIKRSGSNTLVFKTTGAAASLERTSFAVRPEVRIADTHLDTDGVTGRTAIAVTVENTTGKDAAVNLEVSLTADDTGKVMGRVAKEVTAPAGKSVHTLEMTVASHIKWSTVNPFLYTAQVLAATDSTTDMVSCNVGFRDFAVDADGFFILNGERISLKTAQISFAVMKDETAMRKFVDFVRTIGFNAVRPATGAATQGLMSYCDKVGMMVQNRADSTQALSDAAVMSASAGKNHVSCVALGLFEDGQAASETAARTALSAVRESVESVVVLRGGAAQTAQTTVAVSNARSLEFDASLGGGKGAYMAVGTGLLLPENYHAQATSDWYDAPGYGYDKLFANPASLYSAAGKAYVVRAENEINALRGANLLAGIDFAGGIAGYPQTMLDVLNDSLNSLRFCIEAPEIVYAGEPLAFSIKLSDFNVLWNRAFPARIKITGSTGTLYEQTVSLTPAFHENGFGTQVIELHADTVSLNVPTGTYTISAEFTNYAHPACGEKTVYVINKNDLPNLTGTVYTADLSDAAVKTLRAAGAATQAFSGTASTGSVIVTGGKVSDMMAKAAEGGATLIVLGADADSGLPVAGDFVSGMTYSVYEQTLPVPFAGQILYGAPGLAVGAAFAAQAERAAVSGFSFAPDGSVAYGNLIGIYAYGSGWVCVCTPDLNAAAGTALADALLVWAVAAAA